MATKQSKDAEGTFSAEERAAMKERAQEVKAGRGKQNRAEKDAAACVAKIAELPQPDRAIAEGVHAVIVEVAPELAAKTWYGMPAYALDGKVLCFVQPADKFKTRYSTLGFNDIANLDDKHMWPTAYAITEWTSAVEKQVRALVKQAVA